MKKSYALDQNFLWLLQQFDKPVVCLSMAGKIIAINPPATQLFQCEFSDVLNKSFSKVLKEKDFTHNLSKDLSMLPETIEIVCPAHSVKWQWFGDQLVNARKQRIGIILIAYSQPEHQKVISVKSSAEDQSFNMKLLIDDLVDLMQPHAHKKGLALTTYYPFNVPEIVIGHQQRVYQMLLGLVDNAIKYTQKGHIFVTVELVESTEDVVVLRLIVQDTGVGISAEKYHSIFKKSDVGTYQEIDLNLYAIKQLAEVMQGRLDVESVVNSGSTFSLVIPFKIAPEMLLQQCQEEQAVYQINAEQPQPVARVLVVEDDLTCREVLQQFLSDLHYHADIAANAHEALALLRRPYDVILMDIGLPDKDGMSLTREIRTKLNVETPTIAITGYEWDKSQYFAVGFNALLKKPISLEKLQHALFKVLSKR
jgi:CheY-like chemotaxis protein